MITVPPEDFKRFLAEDDGRPVVMLNLLRFKADGGRERYQAYLAKAGPLVVKHGAEILFVGDGLPALAAETGQAWDAVALVRYPSRAAFAALIQDPDYAQADPLRLAALEEAVLQPVSPAAEPQR